MIDDGKRNAIRGFHANLNTQTEVFEVKLGL
jgi:hypothetical protein